MILLRISFGGWARGPVTRLLLREQVFSMPPLRRWGLELVLRRRGLVLLLRRGWRVALLGGFDGFALGRGRAGVAEATTEERWGLADTGVW